MHKIIKASLVLIGSLFAFTCARAEEALPRFNMPKGVTPISQDIYWLHMALFWICVAIGVLVFGVMFYALYKHRKSRGKQPRRIPASTTLEIVLAVVPFIILVVMAIPATRVLISLDDSSDAEVNIKVVGYQWKWRYEYLDEGIEFFSNLSTPIEQLQNKVPKGQWYLLEVDKPLIVPINKKIRFLVTSNDVIHSWWVPALGIKRDAIPGFIYESWATIHKPGIYRGQCAELCGVNHGFMPIVVEAVTQEQYEQWIKQQRALKSKQQMTKATATNGIIPAAMAATNSQGVGSTPAAGVMGEAVASATDRVWTREELMKRGETVFNGTCAVCHKVDGAGMPPAFPALAGSKIATGPTIRHIDRVLFGVKGTAMQAFGEQLSDEDIAAVITYVRNTWGNDDKQKYGPDAGGLVQPKAVVEEHRQAATVQ
jgi:cytochrome c oxidase subunit 2